MMYTFVAALCLVALATVQATPVWHSGNFGEWMDFHGKTYEDESEQQYRYTVYLSTIDDVNAKNAAQTEVEYGVNKFSDLTPKEFAQYYLNAANRKRDTIEEAATHGVMENLNIQREITHAAGNTSIDWFAQGACSPVKDQGQCGSCWAFSATEETESMWFMAGNTLPVLAPQQIVSCDTKGQDQGCNGGFTEGAYAYIQGAGGMMTEASYPYTSGKAGIDGQCKFDASETVATVTGYTYAVPKATFFTAKTACDGGDGILAAIQTAPVSICVNAEPWQSYKSGIMPESQCGSGTMSQDHCVQLTGYNAEGPEAYYIVRNSWNTDWGNAGLIYLAAEDNACGMCDDATIVTA